MGKAEVEVGEVFQHFAFTVVQQERHIHITSCIWEYQ